MRTTDHDPNPVCPYCQWELGEWMDGKKNARENIKCPTCEKTYFCYTYAFGNGYAHRVTKLGRNKNA